VKVHATYGITATVCCSPLAADNLVLILIHFQKKMTKKRC